MAKYKLLDDGVYDNTKKCTIPATDTNADWRAYLKWLDAGNTPDAQWTEVELIERVKQAALKEINAEMAASIPAFVNIDTPNGRICMNAGKQAAMTLNEGILFAELAGIPTLDLVDYHNKVHEGIPLLVCRQIVVEQARPYFLAWNKRAKDRAEIL
jgi:hypothetical protein